MAHPFLRAALAVLFVSSFVFALSAEEVARFYLKSGESMKLEPVAVDGKTFSLVKIDGKPSLVLAPSGSTYQPLVERAELQPVVQAYAQQVYKSKDFQKSADMLNETTPILESVLGSCDRGGTIFLKSFPTRTIRIGKANIGLKYLIDRTAAYATEKKASEDFTASFPAYHESYQAFIPKAQAFGSLVAAADADAVLDSAAVIRDSATTLKTRYDEVSTAYRTLSSSKELGGVLNFTFYDAGTPLKCYPDANATTALARIQNEFSDKSLQPSERLLDTIVAFSAERGSTASQGTAFAIREEEFKVAESSVANVSTQFAGQGYTVDLKALVAKKDALKQALDKIKANGSVAAFDADLAQLRADVSTYQSAVASFKAAAVSIKAAAENVTAAQKKYGEADSRVQTLNTELTALKVNMSSSISLLSSGDASKASTQFTALSQKSADVGQRAGSLPAKGNDLDLPVIGGIVVLLLVLVGTVWYFRKMKGQQPKMGA